jgi:hypothetical protein
MVPNGVAGAININVHSPPMSTQPEFFAILETYRSTLSRELEAGCRPIIAFFLSVAVIQARILFKNERLIVHSEIAVPNVQIPEVGLVCGKLDFMTAKCCWL